MDNNIEDKKKASTPLLIMRLSTYQSQESPNEAFELFGGNEQYSEKNNHLVWSIDSPESARELLMNAIEKYKDKEAALDWFRYLDKKIDNNKISPNNIERFSFTYYMDNPQYDIYSSIESSWIESHDFADEVSSFKNAVGKIDSMKGATEKEWNDAFVLNANNANALGSRMHYDRNKEMLDSWQELIDDLMLVYMGIQIYIGTRKYGTIEGYAI